MATIAERPIDQTIADMIERTKRVQDAARKAGRELRGEPEPPELPRRPGQGSR